MLVRLDTSIYPYIIDWFINQQTQLDGSGGWGTTKRTNQANQDHTAGAAGADSADFLCCRMFP